MSLDNNIFNKSAKTLHSPPPLNKKSRHKASPQSKAIPSTSRTQQHCKSCTGPDNDEMVQCDACDEWHHFQCVNVTSEVETQDWFCPKCETSERTPAVVDSAENRARASLNNNDKSIRNIRLEPIRSKSPTSSRTAFSASTKSTTNSKSAKLRLQKLDEERILKEKRDKEYLDAKYKILEEQSSDAESVEQHTSLKERRLGQWICDQSTKGNKLDFKAHSIGHPSAMRKNVEKKAEATVRLNEPPLNLNGTWVGAELPTINANIHDCLHNSTRHGVGNAHHFHQQNQDHIGPPYNSELTGLNRQQLGSGHIVPKELPSFSGLPEEWPYFISCYENSTRYCRFSNDDNIYRLQRSLKGKALQAVRAQLMYPSQVQNIISTLRMIFGRPETVINSLITKLRNEKAPKAERLDSLVNFALSVQNIVATMETTGLVAHLDNPSLLKELTDKLPHHIRLNWGIFKMGCHTTSLTTFSAWLYQVAQAACEVTEITPALFDDGKADRRRLKGTVYVSGHHANIHQDLESCLICNNECPSVQVCSQFTALSLRQRWDEVKKHSLCRTCLIKHHGQRCTSNKRCGINGCSYRHHKTLHKDAEPSNCQTNSNRYNCNLHQPLAPALLFKILPVTLHYNNITVETYALLDDGSSITLMDEELADSLKLNGPTEKLCLKWTSNTCRTEESSKRVSCQISAIGSEKKYFLSSVRTVQSLDLPVQSVDFEVIKSFFPYLIGIPFSSYYNVKPRLLIGLDHATLTSPHKYREGRNDQPAAIKTRLGWTVFGVCTTYKTKTGVHHNYHACECQDSLDASLHELVRESFAVENSICKNKRRMMNMEDQRANLLLEKYTHRVGNRFSVPLLWKSEHIELPDSKMYAERRLACLEKKLLRDCSLAANLQEQIQDYVRKGYARKLTKEEMLDSRSKRIWYLPIFPVVNPNKPSKVRIVWDAAARCKGVSLNSMLLSGPDDLPLLPEVLFRFRQRRVAICADIKEMFHQIRVREVDQDAQRFLWRNRFSGVMEHYVMQVLTFGSTCSPSCAEFIKNKNALEYAVQFPRAVEAITKNHYVDDFLDSLDTEEEALKLAKEVTYIHRQGGFEIRNFLSNSAHIMKELGDSAVSNKNFKVHDGLYDAEKILGMWWCPATDRFSFLYQTRLVSMEVLTGESPPTKRQVLKILMSIFDPLGLVAHFLVLLKILLQEIWRDQTQWDEEIHADQFKLWKEWLKLLPAVKQIQIRRSYLKDLKFESGCLVELHIFVDASLSAYAAVAYIRVQRGTHVECALVCTRTKVGPLRQISVPRMELQAAVLGVRIAKSIVKGHSIKFNKRYFWSDSQSVLCWVKNESRKVNQFVMFRVGEILECSSEAEWRWVPSAENVADDATKWNTKIDLSSESRWFQGPSFLYQPREKWPSNSTNNPDSGSEHTILKHTGFNLNSSVIEYLRFSSWKRLYRTMAWIFHFLNTTLKRKRQEGNKGLTLEDIAKAKKYLYRMCQAEGYPNEISQLKCSEAPNGTMKFWKITPLTKFSPYLDEDGVMRVKGRIDASNHASFDCKRPIILPKTHYLTLLIVKDYHVRFKHQYFETVINELRQVYYIPTIRMLLRKIQHNCQICKINKATPVPPLMAELPPARLKSFTQVFSYVGVDYFGPMLVTVGRHSEKRWGVLFTCLTVRAIHIEIVQSLSSDSCIMAVQRFCARRGRPVEMWSDNGTNFRGASQELISSLKQLDVDKISQMCLSEGIKWKFIPPASPHMGGSWERLIRSVKQTLAQIQLSKNPKDEVLITMMAEVEYIINSRPLTYVPLDNDSNEALTPNHFLVGSSNGVRLSGQIADDGSALRRNWITCERYGNMFWKRWVMEYLPTLTRRTKWFNHVKPIEKGDVVIIVDANSPRNTWPKGRVLDVHSSKDGQTRSAVIQTATGVYTRPTVRLAVLDINRFGEGGNPVDTTSLPGGSVTKPGNAALH